jgi:hypothetical protein
MGKNYRHYRGAKRYRHRPGRLLFRLAWPFVAVSAYAVFSFASGSLSALPSMPLLGNGTSASCNIKGNVSIATGERIYHVPGQRYYEETRVSQQHGERWFCSEREAREAGWRRSRV